jgi:dolichyl-phosphate beta-glucosyltransferase
VDGGVSASVPTLSVVVPAFDEERRIVPTLETLAGWAAERGGVEVIVVDDGSRDRTAELVSRCASPVVRLVRLPANRGKGAALRAGVAASRGETVLLTDADLSTPITEVARLEPRLERADVVLGSRALPDSNLVRRQTAARELAGKGFNLAIRLLGVRGFRDTQCGFKLLRGEVARRLFAEMTVDRFAYDVELVWLAVRRGHRVEEVGVEWRDEAGSRVRVVRDGLRMLVDVARLRRRFAAADRAARRGRRAPT